MYFEIFAHTILTPGQHTKNSFYEILIRYMYFALLYQTVLIFLQFNNIVNIIEILIF